MRLLRRTPCAPFKGGVPPAWQGRGGCGGVGALQARDGQKVQATALDAQGD